MVPVQIVVAGVAAGLVATGVVGAMAATAVLVKETSQMVADSHACAHHR